MLGLIYNAASTKSAVGGMQTLTNRATRKFSTTENNDIVRIIKRELPFLS